MKKILSTIAATAVLATSSFALDTDKLYVGAGLAIESATDFDSGMAIVLTAGLPVTEKGESGPGTLAVEAETTFDLTSPSTTIWTTDVEASIFTLAAYAAYKHDINEKVYVKPRLGLLYESITMSSGSYSAETTDIGLAMGVQFGYNIDKQLDVVVGYNIVEADVSHLTFGALYRF